MMQHMFVLSRFVTGTVATRLLTLVGPVPILASLAAAQGDPAVVGQWAGPYDELAVNLYNGVPTQTFEIAHSALLPPPIDTTFQPPRTVRGMSDRILLQAVPPSGCADCNGTVGPGAIFGRATGSRETARPS